jgi:hypothetical protein
MFLSFDMNTTFGRNTSPKEEKHLLARAWDTGTSGGSRGQSAFGTKE